MSNSFKIGPMQSCFRSYMKRCHLTHKFTTPRECPPGPLQRLLTQTRSNRNMAGGNNNNNLRSNRSYRNIKKRGFSISQTTISKDNKDMDSGAKFDLVKIEPVVNTGNYCQVLVTLKRKEGEDGRDRWVRNIRRRGSRTVLSVENAVDNIGLGNFYKDRNDMSKVARLDLARAHEQSKREPSNFASCQQDFRKTIESITKLLHSATKKVMQEHQRKKAKSNRKDLALDMPKILEAAETLTAGKMVSKLRSNDHKQSVCPDQQIKEINKDLEDQIECELSIKKVKGQIYHKSEQAAKFYKEFLDNKDYGEIVKSTKVTEANEDCAEFVTTPTLAGAPLDCTDVVAAPRTTEANEDLGTVEAPTMVKAPGECAEMKASPKATETSKDYGEIVTSSSSIESLRDCAKTSSTMAKAPGVCAEMEASPRATEASEDCSEFVASSKPIESHRDYAESTTMAGAPGDCASPRPTEANQDSAEIETPPMKTVAPGDCAEFVRASEPTAASGAVFTETGKRPSLPRIHINIRGSVTFKRNSLGKLEGTYRKKTSTRIQRNDGRPLDISSTI